MSEARSTLPPLSEIDKCIRETEEKLAALKMAKDALEYKAPTTEKTDQPSLHALIDANDWDGIQSRINNNNFTPDDFKARQEWSSDFEYRISKISKRNGVYRLTVQHQYKLIADAIKKGLITSEHLAAYPGETSSGTLGDIIYTCGLTGKHEKVLDIFLDANLITADTLNPSFSTSGYTLFQDTNISEPLRQKFNGYCEAAIQQAQQNNDNETVKQWLDVMSKHLPIIQIMQALNAVLINSGASDFAESLQLMMKHIKRSTAEQKQKQDVVRHYIFAQIAKATDEAQLAAIQGALVKSTELKLLFRTEYFFTTNTSAWDSLQNIVSDSIVLRIDAIEKQRDKAARSSNTSRNSLG